MRVLAISVHPDDEVLGCGGTLLRHADQEDDLHWLILTSISTETGWTSSRVKEREKEIDEVAKRLDASVHRLDHPALELDRIGRKKLVQTVGAVVDEVRPDILYVPNRSDAHSDHRIAFEALIPAMKRFRHPSVRRVLMYECPSESDLAPPLRESAFQPNWFVEISNYLDQKVELMTIYASEMGSHPFPRSPRGLRALAMLRGVVAGVEAAEAFVLLREVSEE